MSRSGASRRRPPAAGAGDGGGGPARSDLLARLIVAIPALIVVVVVVAQGGWVFAGVIAALGVVCLGELFTMFDRTHPVRLAGFVGIVAVILAAQLGGPSAVLGALAACIPLVFVLGIVQVGHYPDVLRALSPLTATRGSPRERPAQRARRTPSPE